LIKESRGIVPEGTFGERLDRAAALVLGISRGQARRLIDLGGVYLDGRRVHVASRLVREGQQIAACWADPPEPEPPSLAPEALLWRGPGFVAVDKPAGVYSQDARHRSRGTLPDLVARLLVLPDRPVPVHRLDVETSGVILLALDPATTASLSLLFQQGRVRKIYQALVCGGPGQDEGRIDLPLEPDPKRPGCMRVAVGPGGGVPKGEDGRREDGREAVTLWRVLERGDGVTRLELEPLTGRMHQLRVHCAAMGWPVQGDRDYGSALDERVVTSLRLRACVLELPGFGPGEKLLRIETVQADF
jgi:23S rRNA pseudouridine1911/1915/1917 synthase